MDRRDLGPTETAYQRDLKLQQEQGEIDYDDKIVENGRPFRVPYKVIKQVAFTNVRKDELVDLEHAARLQYRLLLNDAILKAKVEFAKLTITIVYNPQDSGNLKEKISIEGIVDFLAGEGVHIDPKSMEISDYDYYKNMYTYQFDPAEIREHPPYTYTTEEWKKMRPKWDQQVIIGEKAKLVKFHEWQNSYAETHPEMNLGKIPVPEKKVSFLGKILGGNKKKSKNQEKGFWFHGV